MYLLFHKSYSIAKRPIQIVCSVFLLSASSQLAAVKKHCIICRDKRSKTSPAPGAEPATPSSNEEPAKETALEDDDLPATSKLIKAFQEAKERNGSSPAGVPARQRSPTLRLFASAENGKKTVLERFDDSKVCVLSMAHFIAIQIGFSTKCLIMQ